MKKTPTKRKGTPKKKQTGIKKDGNKDKKQGGSSPKKALNVVYKEATGLTSDEDTDFSSESEGEWDERKTDSQGKERTVKRQSRIIERYFELKIQKLIFLSESDSDPDPENSSTENETDEEAAGPSGADSNAKSIYCKKLTVRKRPAKQKRFGAAPKRILMESQNGSFNPLFEPGRIEAPEMNFSETLGQPMEHETSWTEAELSILTDVLDSMRAKAEHLGTFYLKKYLPKISIRNLRTE